MRRKLSLAKQAGVAAALLLLSACTGTSSPSGNPTADAAAAGQESPQVAEGPAAGPDGAVYAVATNADAITVFESQSDQRRELFQIPGGSGQTDLPVKQSPDQQYIAYIEGYDGRLGSRAVIVDGNGKELASHSGRVAGLVWAPDSQRLILLEYTGENAHESSPPNLVSLRPDGQESAVTLQEPVTRLLGFLPTESGLYAVKPAKSGDQHGEVLVRLQPDTGQVTTLIGDAQDDQFQLLYNEELGAVVAYVREMSPTYQIRISRTTGGDTLVMAESDTYPVEYAVSADVSTAAFVNEEGLWVVKGGQRTAEKVLASLDHTWHLKGVEPDGSVWMFHPQYGYVLLTEGEQLPSVPGQP